MQHVEEICKHSPPVPWFEVLADNHMVTGGPSLKALHQIADSYPLVLHSVGLSLGSVDPLDEKYLKQLSILIDRFNMSWLSEHLCFTSAHGRQFHELIPLPYTEESVRHVVKRIKQAQEMLGRRLLIENVSSYLCYKQSTMTEWQFVSAIAEEADCDLLLDVNNVYVSSVNHGFNALDYLSGLPVTRVKQLHLAGHEDKGRFLLDSHSCEPSEGVWHLYKATITRFGYVPTLIEWDNDIPEFSVLQNLANKADVIACSLIAPSELRPCPL